MNAKFISFEGGDGAGKSTQSKLLKEFLEKNNQKVVLTREPGGTIDAEKIRELLLSGDKDRWHPISELLLHFAARKQHLEEVIKPSLAKNTWVVSDRFVDSTYAYQGYGLGLDHKIIDQIANIAIDKMPDITFILDVDFDNSKKRVISRDEEITRYEKMSDEFNIRLIKGFREIAKLDRCKLIDASLSIEEIHQRIISELSL